MIAWSQFLEKFIEFEKKFEKIEFSEWQIVNLRAILDDSLNNTVSAKTVNGFFNFYWCNLFEKNLILDSKICEEEATKKHKIGKEFVEFTISKKKPAYNEILKLKILSLSQKSYLKYDDEYLTFTALGYNSDKNPNYRGDGVIIFGRKTKNTETINDIFFHEDDKTASRKQFQIVFKPFDKKFYIVCISQTNPTMMKINDSPFPLYEGMMIFIGDNLEGFKIAQIVISNYNENTDTSKKMEIKEEEDDEDEETKTRSKQNKGTHNIFYAGENFNNQEPTLIRKQKEPDSFHHVQIDNSKNKTEIEDDTLPKGSNSKNKTITYQKENLENKESFIKIEGIKGQHSKSKFLFKALNNSDTIVKFGKSEENDLIFHKHSSDFHFQIVYFKEKKQWYIVEKFIPNQTKFSDEGTFVSLKTFDQFKNKLPSNPVLLQSKMIISVEANLLKVE